MSSLVEAAPTRSGGGRGMCWSETERSISIAGGAAPSSVTFVTHWAVSLVSNTFAFGEAIAFVTSYRFQTYEWTARIYRLTTFEETTVHSYFDICVEPVGRHTQPHPVAELCRFSLKLCTHGNDRVGSSEGLAEIDAVRDTGGVRIDHQTVYRMPRASRFSFLLENLIRARLPDSKRVIVTIVLKFPTSGFEVTLDESPTRFNSLTDSDFRSESLTLAKRDYKLICVDGEVETSKHLLFLSSSLMRKQFCEEESASHESTIEYAVAPVKHMLSYAYTGVFTVDKMHTDSAYMRQLMSFGKQYQFHCFIDLKNEVQSKLCSYLHRDVNDLGSTVELLLLANDFGFLQLKRHCIAVIINRYYHTFKNKYNSSTGIAEDLHTFEQLNRGASIFSPSVVQKIHSVFKMSTKTAIIHNF